MNPNGNGKDEAPPTFRMEIDLRLEHMELPAEFYQIKTNELGKKIELKDPMGKTVDVPLFWVNKRAYLWSVVPKLVDIYGLSQNHFIDFVYDGGNKFKIEIIDGNMNQIPYPPLNGQPAQPKNHAFEKEIPELSSDGRVQKFYLPRRFVQDYVLKEWKNLIIQPEGGGFYVCKLLWGKRNGSNYYCHLGSEWYQFVGDKNLVPGDKVRFESVSHEFNIVKVRIVRRQVN